MLVRLRLTSNEVQPKQDSTLAIRFRGQHRTPADSEVEHPPVSTLTRIVASLV